MRKWSAFYIALVFSVAAPAKPIRVVSQEFMPLVGSKDGKTMTGAYYELIKKVCEKIEAQCTFEIYPLARVEKMLESGEAHVGLAMAKTPKREANYNFPPSISQVGYTFFVKKGHTGKYKKFEDFKGKTVGVHGGSATHRSLETLNEKHGKILNIAPEPTSETPMRKLNGDRYGKEGAGFCSRPVCLYQAKKENLAIEPVSFDPYLQSHSAPVSKKGVDEATFKKISAAIVEVMKSPEMKKIFNDYQVPIHPEVNGDSASASKTK